MGHVSALPWIHHNCMVIKSCFPQPMYKLPLTSFLVLMGQSRTGPPECGINSNMNKYISIPVFSTFLQKQISKLTIESPHPKLLGSLKMMLFQHHATCIVVWKHMASKKPRMGPAFTCLWQVVLKLMWHERWWVPQSSSGYLHPAFPCFLWLNNVWNYFHCSFDMESNEQDL